MLEVLKEQLKTDTTSDLVMEAAAGSDIRDVFLDNLDTVVLGAENDPAINKLIDRIPEYDDIDPEFAKEVEALTESTLLVLE